VVRIKKWQKLSSDLILDNKYLKVRKDKVKISSGLILDDYYLVERPDVVLIIPVTFDNKIVLIEEYKHAAGKVMLTLPAGMILNNTTPEKTAKEELLEETGFKAASWEKLGVLTQYPTKDTNKFYVFLAKNAYKIAKQKLDPKEEINIRVVSLVQLKKYIAEQKFIISECLAALNLAFQKGKLG